MAKVFEDQFMELQINMLEEAIAAIDDDADMIYVYGACEGDDMGIGFFYERDNVVYDSQYIYDRAEKNGVERIMLSHSRKILNILMDLVTVCKNNDKPMPTEIKLYYDCNRGTLNTEYQYDPVFSFDEDLIPHDIFTEWVEETKRLKKQ